MFRQFLWICCAAYFLGLGMANSAQAGIKIDAGSYRGDNEAFGTSVATYQNWMIVGVPADESGFGAVYFYKKKQVWNPWGTGPYYWPVEPNHHFEVDANCSRGGDLGWAVDIDGDFAVAGAPGCNDNTGLAYVYENVDGIWSQVNVFGDNLEPSAPQRFGSSISIAQDWLVVGSPDYRSSLSDPKQGKAKIFLSSLSSWQDNSNALACNSFTADVSQDDDLFAFDVDVTIGSEAVWVILGAPDYDMHPIEDTGAAFVVRMDPEDCDDYEQIKLTSSLSDEGHHLGTSVGIQVAQLAGEPTGGINTIAVAGAPGYEYLGDESGAVFTFRGSDESMPTEELPYPLVTSNYNASLIGREIGTSLDMHHNIIVVGEPGYDDERGGAASYQLTGVIRFWWDPKRGWIISRTTEWRPYPDFENYYYTASDAWFFDRFGESVAFSLYEGHVVAGVPADTYLLNWNWYARAGTVWTEFDHLPCPLYVPNCSDYP